MEVLYLSCPAVSQICRFVFSPSTNILFIWKSTPGEKKKRKADLYLWAQASASV